GRHSLCGGRPSGRPCRQFWRTSEFGVLRLPRACPTRECYRGTACSRRLRVAQHTCKVNSDLRQIRRGVGTADVPVSLALRRYIGALDTLMCAMMEVGVTWERVAHDMGDRERSERPQAA